MQPNGANKNKVAHAIFSKEGPYLISPEDTKIPNEIPNKWRFIKRISKIKPKSNIDTPKKGIAKIETGINPINVLKTAVIVKAKIISLILKGEINKLVKFLLQISSRNIIL